VNTGCNYDPTTLTCVTPLSTSTDVTDCVSQFTSPTPPLPTGACPGANHPCSCPLSNSNCAILAVDAAKTGVPTYTCMNANDANAKQATIGDYDATIPVTVITSIPPICATPLGAGGAVGGSVGASVGASTASSVGQSLSVPDVETSYMYCVINHLPSTSNLKNCITSIIAARPGAPTDPQASSNDFSLTMDHYVSCPPGVVLTQSDLDGDACTCMRTALDGTTGSSFGGGMCTNTLSATKKRSLSQATASITTMTVNTNNGGNSTPSTAFPIWAIAVVAAGGVIAIFVVVALIIYATRGSRSSREAL